MQLESKIFVVTGGGNGIGREVVRGLLARGSRVAALDLSEAGLQETAELAGAGDRLTTHVVDITDRAAVLALPQQVVAVHEEVDGLVNVAGIIHDFKPVNELSFEAIERVMDVNFWGTVNTVKAFLPLLLERPAAAIVNVSSMGAYGPVPGQTAYGASKAAVRLLTEGLYAELMDTAVQVTVVHPGGIATSITDNSGAAMPEGVENMDDRRRAELEAKLTSPQEAARQIIEAIEKNRPRVRIGNDAKMLDRMIRLMPSRGIGIIKKNMEKMLG
ncbi:short-chain dehydrogenase [Nocardioides sp. Root1257]|uniref:SDR family NAD(P)-dependent oxidoreductase n=1 Tax=unclassified Nocardioides TaxID=2615069 RepID=UPI0006F5344F|nr:MULTISPECIES: SDR family NAD(P)-dependent oxidoreductase [unclassified Nocardioides]KQW43925.1 short-chain dehydrogenase [Nocardioides sp. Root1257]KRC42366.1 short-chain dehydrogenase [Nocardioides sp. Root224]